jgi:hypothetical protein
VERLEREYRSKPVSSEGVLKQKNPIVKLEPSPKAQAAGGEQSDSVILNAYHCMELICLNL